METSGGILLPFHFIVGGVYYIISRVFLFSDTRIFSQSSAITEKRPENAAVRASSGRLTENFDCAEFYMPTASSLHMLARFSSRDECTYLSKVTVVVEWPRISLSVLISKPTSTARVANV